MWRLKHPVHGFMHVYDLMELRRHEGLGWQIDAPGSIPKLPERSSDNKFIDVVASLAPKRKPGRPRKHAE